MMFRLFSMSGVELGVVIAAGEDEADAVAARDFGSAADGGWLETCCRVCGCSQSRACRPPCHWVEPDLCSHCAGPRRLAA